MNAFREHQRLAGIVDTYLDVQHDILETFVDRGQLRQLAEPTVLPSGKRLPGLKLDHPRQLALMHALVRFAHLAAGGTFKTADLYPHTVAALGVAPESCHLASLPYDLSKLRGKGLVEKVPRSRRYRLLPHGDRLCVVFLKLFERIYAPLTAGLLQPVRGDGRLQDAKRHQLDRLYQRVVDDLDRLLHAVGLNVAACPRREVASDGIISSALEAHGSQLLRQAAQREQNSRCAPHNGLKNSRPMACGL